MIVISSIENKFSLNLSMEFIHEYMRIKEMGGVNANEIRLSFEPPKAP